MYLEVKDVKKSYGKDQSFIQVLNCAMLLIYLLINKLLMRKINRITPAEVLKNRE